MLNQKFLKFYDLINDVNDNAKDYLENPFIDEIQQTEEEK